jgi:hypothetical protein
MTFTVKRQCGCAETVQFRGSAAAWTERESLMTRTPCTMCHAKRLQEKVSQSVPSLIELCFGGDRG